MRRAHFAWMIGILPVAWAAEAAAQDPSDAIFNENTVTTFKLSMSRSSWDFIRNNQASETYHRATFTWQSGTTTETLADVGVRPSGGGVVTRNQDPEKPSLRLSFDEFVQGRRWRGLKSIKLDASSSFSIQQRLGYWVYRQYGVPASRQSSCRFVLNLGGSDDYRGCYGVEEVIKKAFIRYRWPNLDTPDGNLYKLDNQTSTWSVDSYRWRGTDPSLYVPMPFSPKTNEVGGDYRDIVNLCNVLNNVPLSSRRTELDKIMNVDRQLAVLAVCSSLGDSDGLFNNMRELNNHYWYHREDTNKLEVLPWDVDGSFVYQPYDTSAWKWFYETRPTQGGNNPSVLNAWIPNDRVARESFAAKVRQVVAGALSGARSRADFIYNQIRSHVYADPYKPITNAEFDAKVQAIKTWIPQRITFLQGEMAIPAVTITAVDAAASEPGSDTASFRVSRTGATSAPLTVDLTIGGTATNGTDFNTVAASVTIPRGQSSATVTVTPKDDTMSEGSETVTITIAGHPSYTVGAPSGTTLTIADNESAPAGPTVTVTATDSTAGEPTNAGAFTVTRTGATSASLSVTLSRGGTATNGTDYNSIATTVTIPAGQASATITVTPIDDTAVEGSETVILTVASNAAYSVGSPSSATVTIADNDTTTTLPTVTIAATDASAGEPTNTGTFTISRTGATTASLTVTLSRSGTATNGTDYNSISTTVTIPAGQASATITVTPIDDTAVEGSETVILTVASNAAYSVGTAASATVTIADDDTALPTVTIAATDGSAEEPTNTGTFTVTRTGATTAALTVTLSRSGSATNGTDYTSISTSLTLPAGQASATVTVTPIDDTAVEGSETVVLSIATNTAYTVGTPSSATVTIADNDTPGTTTVAFQDGAAPASTYAGTRDTTLSQNTPAVNLGTNATLQVDGDDVSGSDLVTLLRWDLSAIPQGSVIQSATITLNVTNVTGNSYPLYEARRAWGETQATWNDSAAGTPWQTPGAQGALDRGTTALGTLGPNAMGSYSFSLNASGVAVVQGWVDSPSTNLGFVVASASNPDSTGFDSREAATPSSRPKLTLVYAPSAGTGLSASYYDNQDFTGPTVTRTDPTVDFNWSSGSPASGINPDTFSSRWTGRVRPQYSETYTFYTLTNDGARLWVEGEILVDKWVQQSGGVEWSGQIALQAGVWYTIQMDHYEGVGNAIARLSWSSPSTPKQVIPQGALDPALGAPDSRDNDGDGVPNDSDLDDDQDGVPDLQDADRDGDGATNLAERAAGTDPDDGSSPGGGTPTAALSAGDNSNGDVWINDRCAGGSIPPGGGMHWLSMAILAGVLVLSGRRAR